MDQDSKNSFSGKSVLGPGVVNGGPDRRNHPRVAPAKEDPVLLRLDGNEYPVVDISLGGISYQGASILEAGTRLVGELRIPGENLWREVGLIVLRRSISAKISCKFEFIDKKTEEAVTGYVLERQRALLESVASGELEEDPVIP